MVMVMMMMTGRRIRGEDISDIRGERSGAIDEKRDQQLLLPMFKEESNDSQSWRGVRCGSSHSSS